MGTNLDDLVLDLLNLKISFVSYKMIMDIAYRQKSALEQDILGHLLRCNNYFMPPLSEKVNIEDYSNKIFQKAVTFEAWSANMLIGLVAAYFSDLPLGSAFITNVSVDDEYKRNGISSKLLSDCITEAKKRKCVYIDLEVYDRNISAIQLYKKFNFVVKNDDAGLMRLSLPLI